MSIPKYEPDGEYTSRIELDYKPKTEQGQPEQDWQTTSTSGSYKILIDNTPPTNVEINKKSSSGKKIIVSPTAYDIISNYYTSWNEGKGRGGIAKFTAQLKDLQGTVLTTKEATIKDSWENIVLKSNAISPNTDYNVYVSATDLAGNISAPVSLKVTTPANPPTNLYATNTGYDNFILHWTAANGATGYEIYNITNKTVKHIGFTVKTKFTVKNLKMGKTYKFAIKSQSKGGLSEFSKSIIVTTVEAKIIGENTICEQETYTIENLLPGYTTLWSSSNNTLKLVSGQGTRKAVFKKNGNGECLIQAKIAGNKVQSKKVWVGAAKLLAAPALCEEDCFSQNIDIPLCLFDYLGTQNEVKLQVKPQVHFTLSTNNVDIFSVSNNISVSYGFGNILIRPLKKGNGGFRVRVKTDCGWSNIVNVGVTVTNCNGFGSEEYYFLSPNDDGYNDTWEIYTHSQYSQSTFTDMKMQLPTYQVRIFNSKGKIVYQKYRYMQDSERFEGVGNFGSYTGVNLPEGNYYFTITGSETKSGNLYLKRE